jgi:hypothetical protein
MELLKLHYMTPLHGLIEHGGNFNSYLYYGRYRLGEQIPVATEDWERTGCCGN